MARNKNGAGMTQREIDKAIKIIHYIIKALNDPKKNIGGRSRLSEKLKIQKSSLTFLLENRIAVDSRFVPPLVRLANELGVKYKKCPILAIDLRPDIYAPDICKCL